MNKQPVINEQPIFIIIQTVNNRLLNCELDEYYPPKKVGFMTYTLEVPTNSDDVHSAFENRILAFANRFMLENGFKNAVVNRLNNKVVLSQKIEVSSTRDRAIGSTHRNADKGQKKPSRRVAGLPS